MTNQPDPTPPDSSTEDLGDPSSDPGQNMEGMDQGNGISLTQDQAKLAGIHEPMPGDEYTITIKVGDTSQGISATILDGSAKKADAAPNDMDESTEDPDPDASDAVQDDAENPEESTPPLAVKPAVKGKFKMKILGPKDMGMDK